jgi:hypothetical protein
MRVNNQTIFGIALWTTLVLLLAYLVAIRIFPSPPRVMRLTNTGRLQAENRKHSCLRREENPYGLTRESFRIFL